MKPWTNIEETAQIAGKRFVMTVLELSRSSLLTCIIMHRLFFFFFYLYVLKCIPLSLVIKEPRCEKPGLRGSRPGYVITEDG